MLSGRRFAAKASHWWPGPTRPNLSIRSPGQEWTGRLHLNPGGEGWPAAWRPPPPPIQAPARTKIRRKPDESRTQIRRKSDEWISDVRTKIGCKLDENRTNRSSRPLEEGIHVVGLRGPPKEMFRFLLDPRRGIEHSPLQMFRRKLYEDLMKVKRKSDEDQTKAGNVQTGIRRKPAENQTGIIRESDEWLSLIHI